MKSCFKNIASISKLKRAVKASISFFVFLLMLVVAILLIASVSGAQAHADDPIRFTVSRACGSTAFVYNRNEFYQPVVDGQQNHSMENQESDNQENEEDNNQDITEYNNQDITEYNNQDITEADNNESAEAQTVLPSRYLLTVDKLTATPVRDQGRVGSCWAFGAIAAAESSLVNDGLATVAIDLAEKHFTWFEHTPISALSSVSNTTSQPLLDNQSLASKVGEGYTITNANGTSAEEPSTNWRIANLGGFASSVYKLFATGQGPALESVYPYNSQASSAATAALTGDWSIAADQRFTQQNYDLTDCNILPSVYVKKKGTSAVGINAVKNEISRGRCVATGIHVSGSGRELGRDSAYTKGGYSYMYTYNEESTNHEVTIVGYDDNIPASTFAMGSGSAANTPPANGAFLVKDSAGSNFALRADGTERTAEDKAASTGGGYYWVSYYDKSLYEQMTCKFQAPTGYKCYAYDIIGNATNVVDEYIRDDGESEAADTESNNTDNTDSAENTNSADDTDSVTRPDDTDSTTDAQDSESSANKENDTDFLSGLLNSFTQEADNTVADTPLYAANIYTASEDLKINEISVESLGDTDTLTIEVRVLDPDEEGNFPRITTVEPATTIQNKRFEFGGYHRLKLDEPIPVRQGHKFAIAVSHLLDNGDFAIPYTMTRRQITSDNSSGYTTNGCTINCNSIVNPGESVVFYNDIITDITEAAQNLDKNYTYQNFTLNAYTSPATEDEILNYEESHKPQDPIIAFFKSILSICGI